MPARYAWQNYTQLGGAVLGASSAQNAQPVRWLRDQIRQKRWRSKSGWTVVTGWNDRIDFNLGGVLVATITAGTYATATDYAAAVTAALTAAYGTGTWTVSYSTSTYKFTIAHSVTAHTLLFASGANLARSAALDLGFTATDKGSATSHTAEGVAYQSRQHLTLDVGAAIESKAVVLLDHNLLSTATATAAWAASAANALASPVGTQVLAGTDPRVSFISSTTYRYWALVLNNVAAPAGYTEAGIWYVGSYFEPARKVLPDVGVNRKEFSEVAFSDYGVHYLDEKASAKGWGLSYRMLPAADATAFHTMLDFVKNGRNLFFTIDPTNAPTATVYGYIEGVDATRMDAVPEHWEFKLGLREAVAG